MHGLIGYTLVFLSAIAIVVSLFLLGEYLLVILIFCPFENCIPKFLIFLILGLGVIAILFWLMRLGIKIAAKPHRRN
jgi:hypothetical protein